MLHASQLQSGKFLFPDAVVAGGHFYVRPANLAARRVLPSSNNVVFTDKLGSG